MTDFRKLGKGITSALTKASEAANAQRGVLPAAERDANLAKMLEGSKVKERLYHGTTAHDDYVDESGQAFNQFAGRPTWLAKEPYTASGYVGKAGSMYPVHAQVKKPLALRFDANDDAKKAFPIAKRFGVDVDHMVSTRNPEYAWQVINDPAFVDAVEAAGHDGLMINEGGYKTYGVFDPRKIKSATGNRGTYDITDPDISKAKGGVLHMADAGKVVRGGLKAIQAASKAADEQMARMLSHSGDTALPLMLPRANPSSDFINQQAERVARQMLGEHVVSGQPKKTANLAGRSAKESQRVKGLDYKLTPTGTVAQEVPYAPRRGDLKVAVPGDQTVSNKILDEVNGFPIDSVQEGGAYYGLGQKHLVKPEFWKSNEEPAKRMQGKVDRVAELYEPDRVIGTHLAMGPRSNNFAMHFADANLRAIDWAKADPNKIDIFDSIIAYGYKDPKTKEMVKFPNWPGLADREGALAAMKEDANLRKWFNDRMKTPKLTKPLGLPNGLDIQYAISEPRLRDMEINMTGLMTGELKPGALVEAAGTPHNTYTHRILGEAGGPQEVLTPFVIDFPDAAQHIASTKKPADFTGTIQKVFPHQLVDDQYLNQYGEYRDRIKALTGQKEGGAINRKESPEDIALFHKRFALHKATGGKVDIPRLTLRRADGGRIAKGLMGAFNKASKAADTAMAARKAPQEDAMRLAQQRAALPPAKGGLGLPANNTPAQRAKAMGFDTDVYHGSKQDINKFKGDQPVFAAEDPDIAGLYGNAIYPLKLRGEVLEVSDLGKDGASGRFSNNLAKELKIPRKELEDLRMPMPLFDDSSFLKRLESLFTKRFGDPRFSDIGEREMVNKLPKHGIDRLKVTDMSDMGGTQTQHMIPAGSDNIRSRFAAFDPFRKDAAIAAAMGVLAPDLLAKDKEEGKARGGKVHMDKGGDVKDKSFGERLFKKFEHLPKIGPPSPFSPLDVAYKLYKYKTGAFPIENWYSDLEFRTKPRPIDTGSMPVGTQFNSSDFDSNELNKKLEPVQSRAKGGAVGQESPEDIALFHKRFALHKATGGKIDIPRLSLRKPQKFDGGGIASPEESSASDGKETYAGLMAEFLAKAAKDQGKEELSSLSKPRAATDLLNRGVLANNPVSAMVDLVNMGLVPLDVLGSKLTGRDIKVSSEKPFLGSEYVKDLMNKYNVTSGEERPMMETALSFASPAGMIKGAMKAPELTKKTVDAVAATGRAGERMAEKYVPKIMDRGGLGAEILQGMSKNTVSPLDVYHGSPYKYNKFDASKIGTGEGAQAYGHGIYTSEAPEVGKGYQATLGHKGALDLEYEANQRGIPLSRQAKVELMRQSMRDVSPKMAVKNLQNASIDARNLDPDKLAALVKDYMESKQGSFYKVDLPDAQIAKMLDWDKPLNQQSKEVQAVFKNVPRFKDSYIASKSTAGEAYGELSGILGGREKASEALRQAGIPGIKYLDGNSRGGGKGTRNFVTFPGEEQSMTILERNGQPLKARGGLTLMR